MFAVELLCLAAALAAGLLLPAGWLGMARPLRRPFVRLSRRRTLAIASIAGGVLAFEAVMGWGVHLPVPALHDEFSYLLAADTFATGRLTNPTHPCWEHLESYNVIQQPTYQSKFPPAQGLALAAGQFLTDEPIVGAWLATAAACGAVCWMAYGWLPARWALTCGLLAAVNVQLLRFWGHSYMGGAVALLGGALVFGALRRMWRRWRTRDALLLAAGLLLLANSRPYEGLIASLPVAGTLAVALVKGLRRSGWSPILRTLAPAAGVLAAGFLAMGLYNLCVTGSPWRFPYQVWHETYQTGSFWTQTLLTTAIEPGSGDAPPRTVGSPPNVDDWQLWLARRSDVGRKLLQQWQFYVGLLLTPALLAVPVLHRRQAGWTLLAAATCSLVLIAICLQNTNGHAHYAAPIGGLLLVLVVQGLRNIAVWRPAGQPRGRWVVDGLVAGVVATSVAYVATDWALRPVLAPLAWSLERAAVERTLGSDATGDLVIVRYPDTRETGVQWQEWVYNRADVDRADVVWARDLGAQKNQALLEYFTGRRVWLLDLATRHLKPLPTRIRHHVQHDAVTKSRRGDAVRDAASEQRAKSKGVGLEQKAAGPSTEQAGTGDSDFGRVPNVSRSSSVSRAPSVSRVPHATRTPPGLRVAEQHVAPRAIFRTADREGPPSGGEFVAQKGLDPAQRFPAQR